ncbi:hypothetical protein GSI_07713 [Ganoderma sinense ZZ0214-1]|uniref:F-box domain-containing protein n=1 Tax=Ganoderma sinense ZZ0214-1 TaxID=1077348 RepID=A0A2G8S8Q4_9APHY|nr:hypothetical protein GSI_07713 [Ganoderma sinense ZZ0214-1]
MLSPKKSPLPFFAAPCGEMSIDALQLITEQIGADVKILVHALGQREGKCTDTLKSLYAAFGQGLAIVGGLMNAAAPINRIPSELLTTIFALSPRTQSPGFGQIQVPFWPFKPLWVDDLHRLPKVCRYWRELALATPTLWSTIVTVPPPDHWKRERGDYCFRRSVYLPYDCSLDLTVHFDPRQNCEPSQDSAQKMIKFMLTNSRRTRQLHALDIASSIGDPLSFLQSFDAHALEHCTFWWKTGLRVEPPRELSSKPGHLLFFSNGGARLRSLCLVDVLVLPENEFPMLTLLEIGFIRRRAANMLWEMEDLFDFLAGCPNLEELYLHDIPDTDRHASSRRQPGSSITVSLPRLQYLAFTYRYPNDKKPKYNVDDSADPIDFLLSRISIPPSCHMYLGSPAMEIDADRVLASVCRHVPGKDAVSHMFLRPSNDVSSPIQLVFRHGSLRLHIPKDSSWVLQPATASHFAYHDFFRAFPHLFTTTAEVRIHYNHDYVMTPRDAPFPVPAAVFPQVTALSVIRDTNRAHSPDESRTTLRAGLAHLVQPPCKPLPRRSRSGNVTNATARPGLSGRSPYPLLDTLWTSVESTDEVGELETALTARSAAGLPIRRLVVTLRHYPLGDSAARDGDIARLRAIGAGVEEVVVMDGEASSELREVDWLAGLPERYDLPSSIHRDWPAVWGR